MGALLDEDLALVDADLLATLDSTEGPEFRRRLTPVRLDDGRKVRAWTYWFNGSVRREVPIPDGDYRRHAAVHLTGGAS